MPLFVVTGIVSILLIPPDTDQNGPKFSLNKHKKKTLGLATTSQCRHITVPEHQPSLSLARTHRPIRNISKRKAVRKLTSLGG